MEAYSELSRVYDTFMDNIPYDRWFNRIHSILKENAISKGIVCELGCGTGVMTELLADAGYDMIGIDSSMEMLEIAMDKRIQSKHESILYLNQDMRDFELYGTVRAIVSVCDSVNYLLEDEDVIETFKLVNNYLDPDGIFIFDFTTENKYAEIEENTIAENREEGSFIWENTYYSEERINEYELTLFIPDEHGKYDRYNEIHQQRAYTFDEMKSFLEQTGLEIISSEDDYTGCEVNEGSERIVITARLRSEEA